MFIDATYEGDLMALAGVDYHVGREANSVYGEQWNGVQVGVFQHGHYFKNPSAPTASRAIRAAGYCPKYPRKAQGQMVLATVKFKPIVTECVCVIILTTGFLSQNQQIMIPPDIPCTPGFLRAVGAKPSINSTCSQTGKRIQTITGPLVPILLAKL